MSKGELFSASRHGQIILRARWRWRVTTAALTHGERAGLLAMLAFVAACLLAPIVIPGDPAVPEHDALSAPLDGTLLGTDQIGRDLLVRVAYGLRTSLWSAAFVVGVGVAVGLIVGLVAGAAGGWIDMILMRTTDLFLALPGPIIAIAVAAALGASLFNTLIALSLVWWPPYARLVRGEVRALRVRPHYEAARLSGIGRGRRSLRHLLPGTVGPVLVAASVDVGLVVLTLAGLSFLGLGSPAPAPELGAMVQQGLPYLFEAWWVPIVPALCVFVLALTANLAGDVVRSLVGQR